MNENVLVGVTATILAHLSPQNEGGTAEQIHAMWNAWPKRPEPLAYTISGLLRLEEDGYVERALFNGQEMWRRKIRMKSI
jgi:hypothetical protein